MEVVGTEAKWEHHAGALLDVHCTFVQIRKTYFWWTALPAPVPMAWWAERGLNLN